MTKWLVLRLEDLPPEPAPPPEDRLTGTRLPYIRYSVSEIAWAREQEPPPMFMLITCYDRKGNTRYVIRHRQNAGDRPRYARQDGRAVRGTRP